MMDRGRFDTLTRMFAVPASRRSALAVLIGWGLASAREGAAARHGKHRPGSTRRRPGSVAAQATCGSPGPSSNLNGCNFNDAEFAGIDLSSSSMRGTRFRRADLICADLSSSNLRIAEFQNADLTKADLHSSACSGASFTGATLCGTIMCNGTVRNDDCPGGHTPCCGADDCPGDDVCVGGFCASPICPTGADGCVFGDLCGDACTCSLDLAGNGVCVAVMRRCAACTKDAQCTAELGSAAVCIRAEGGCCVEGTVCAFACGSST